ncbi:Pentatricopeptide repeat [Dillenia turbinata]|uniref:Pentatricopeptide repeat n=1 Tax=Dillenia turbinata TaxID=194707 RepID=A0AAN8YX90_9MAGN
MLTTGLIKDKYFTTKLILTFCSSPHKPLIEFSRYFFFSQYVHLNQRSDDDPFLWNAIIKSFSHGHDPKSAFDVFCLMLENGVYVDKYSCSLVLKGCASIGLLREGMQIHCLMKKLGIGSDVFLENCLICFYWRCGCVGCARQMFDRMLKRDCVSFNSMINGYVKFGMVALAHELFDSMPMEDRNSISWNTMISGYVQSLDGFLVALELFGKMPKKDVVSWNLIIGGCVKRGKMEDAYDMFRKMPVKDGVSWANMIYGYGEIGKVDVARSFFDEMPERDVIACNVMLTGYVQHGYCTEALQLFQYMQSGLGLLPDSATLSIVLSAIAQLGYMDDGVAIHHYIEEQRLCLGGKLGAALIDMYAKCGSIENAMLVFESIEYKDVDHWNAVIGGLAIHGLGEMAFELFMDMESLLVKPDDITFIGVLSACGHAGLLKEDPIVKKENPPFWKTSLNTIQWQSVLSINTAMKMAEYGIDLALIVCIQFLILTVPFFSLVMKINWQEIVLWFISTVPMASLHDTTNIVSQFCLVASSVSQTQA